MLTGWMLILLFLCSMILIAKPMGHYIYTVFNSTELDITNTKIEKFCYRIAGLKKLDNMTWSEYARALLITNFVCLIVGYIIILLQQILPFNSSNLSSLDPILAFNTVISFITNTDLQHYSPESSLSNFSQMAVLTSFMFVAPATALATFVAVIRGVSGNQLGNFFVDFVRGIIRIFLPGAIILTFVLVACGTPQTLHSNTQVNTLEGAKQQIALGPVASQAAIKYLGGNGGGFFTANSAHPYDSPNYIANLIQIFAMLLITMALPFTYGKMLGKPKEGRILFILMFALLASMIFGLQFAEQAGNPSLTNSGLSANQGNLEGKEVRFGNSLATLFAGVSNATSTGATSIAHDSMTPLGSLVPMIEMILNMIFGGIGIGLLNLLLYVILAVFIAGLMIGRTPELLGRKIEAAEIKIIILLLVAHPILVLCPTAFTLMTKGAEAISNPGFHGVSQVFYEFLSSSSNNGSGFEGLRDNTLYWNLSTAFVMLVARYLPIVAFLAVANLLLNKKPVPATPGTFRTDTNAFLIILFGIVLIVGALTFLPVLVLGPIAEFLGSA